MLFIKVIWQSKTFQPSNVSIIIARPLCHKHNTAIDPNAEALFPGLLPRRRERCHSYSLDATGVDPTQQVHH